MPLFDLGNYKTYVWKGITRLEKKTVGIIVAQDDYDAEIESQKLGIFITSIKRRPFWLLPGSSTNRIKILDISRAMRQLSTLISAGIPLAQALDILASGFEKVRLRVLFFTIRDTVASGQTFSEALAYYPQFFNHVICGLIHAGEQSGTLDKMTNQTANYLEHQEKLKYKVERAMYYPALVVTVAFAVILIMLLFLIPRFEQIYASFNAKLPAFTLKIIGLSHILRENWLTLIIGLLALIWFTKKLLEKSERCRYIVDNALLHLPLFGKLIRHALISRICGTLSITLAAGVPLMDALDSCAKIPKNLPFRDAILFARDQVEQGNSMARALTETQLFSVMVSQMIDVGEKSGSLDKMLAKIGEYYTDQVDTAIEGLTSLIEPLLIILIAIIVGVFLFAMYLPIFNLGLMIR